MSVLSLEHLYTALGLYVFGTGVMAWRARKSKTTIAFWCLLSVLLMAADYLPSALTGALVIALTFLARDGLRRGHNGAHAKDDVMGDDTTDVTHVSLKMLLTPLVLLPLVTVLAIVLAKYWPDSAALWLDTRQVTLSALALGALLAIIAALLLTRIKIVESVRVSTTLLHQVGWVVLMPTILATLGAVLAKVHLGDALAQLLLQYLPVHNALSSALLLALTMALMTMLLGNAFAAFPIVMLAIGIPVFVLHYHVNIAALAAITMLTGYCGTLLTPMAANYNLLPVALLSLPDRYAVIRAQLPTALALFICNIILLYWLVLP